MGFDGRCWGYELKGRFDEEISPEQLYRSLQEYREWFGKEFTLQQLLQIEEMRSRALIAGAISDFPEYLADQIGLMQNDHAMPTVAKSLDYLAEILERYLDEK